jgi:ABC-type microcin C transport system permease subunit YejB
VPIATVIGIGIALLIGGAIVTETVFALPGVGRLTVDAILRRDYPIIQGVVLIFSPPTCSINLAVDLSYMFFDPRIAIDMAAVALEVPKPISPDLAQFPRGACGRHPTAIAADWCC